jgi:hypothetical protein
MGQQWAKNRQNVQQVLHHASGDLIRMMKRSAPFLTTSFDVYAQSTAEEQAGPNYCTPAVRIVHHARA